MLLMVSSSLAYDAELCPAYAAAICGALFKDLNMHADAPPLFIAVSADDELAAEPCLKQYQAWHTAGHSAELHIYAKRGHSYGMAPQGLPSDS